MEIKKKKHKTRKLLEQGSFYNFQGKKYRNEKRMEIHNS